MKRLAKISICIFLLSLSIIYSCSNENEICTTCSEKPLGEKVINLSILSDHLSFNSNYYFGRHNDEGSYEFGQSGMVNDEFKMVNNVIKKYIDEETDPYAIAFYFDNFLSTLADTDSCKAIGFSTYTYSNGKIMHRLYKKQNNSFIESSDEYAEVNTIVSNQLIYILQNSFASSPTCKKSCVLVKNIVTGRNVPKTQVNALFLKQKFGTRLKSLKQNAPCGVGCLDNISNTYCDVSGAVSYCASYTGKICPEERELKRLGDDETVNDTILAAFDTTLHRNFRDKFLGIYSGGQKYISYYYELGYFLGDHIPLNLSLETGSILFRINICLNKLLNPSIYGNTIVLDGDLADDIIDLLTNYKNLSNDLDYLLYLDDLISDVRRFKGLTVDEIILELH